MEDIQKLYTSLNIKMITTRNKARAEKTRNVRKILQPEKGKGSESLVGTGVDKLTLGWVVNTLYECGLDLSGTRVDGGGFF
jgi:hypothetical protein